MGANISVTDKKHPLVDFEEIDPYPIGGVEADNVAIVCTVKDTSPGTHQRVTLIWQSAYNQKSVME